MNTRAFVALSAVVAPCLAHSQTPDFKLVATLRPTQRTIRNSSNAWRWYDHRARHSTVGLRLFLEPGFQAMVSQRLQQIPNDPDRDSLDEYYVEDPGHWRVGKQVLPFGRAGILRENVLAARTQTRLVFEDVPITIAGCDAGHSLTRGAVGRLGTRLGLSFALGNHFGIAPASLIAFREPEASPGKGRGYREVFGADYSFRLGIADLFGEFARFREGETSADRNMDVSEVGLRFRLPGLPLAFEAAWSREWIRRTDGWLLEVQFQSGPNLRGTGYVRYLDGHWRDVGLSLMVSLGK